MEKINPSSPEEQPIVLEEDSFEATEETREKKPTFEYKILKGHSLPNGEFLSTEQLHTQYLQLADELIRQIVDGAKVFNPETKEMEIKIPSVVILLDKSGRPLLHLLRAAWAMFARDPETGETPPMPEFKFLNIDREQWVNSFDPSGRGFMDIDKIDPSITRSLRSIHLKPEGKKRLNDTGLTAEVDELPTTLDNETILIVDETYSTGRTARIAADLVKRAIPTASVGTAHWMHRQFTVPGKGTFNQVPVWYSDTNKLGRGVGDRISDGTVGRSLDDMTERDFYHKFGAFFLSSRLPEKDEGYHQLIKEFKQLFEDPDTLFIPSLHGRTDKEMDDRIIAYNYPEVDLASLSDEQREAYVQEVIARKQAMDARQ